MLLENLFGHSLVTVIHAKGCQETLPHSSESNTTSALHALLVCMW
jgi:hypothetical protein